MILKYVTAYKAVYHGLDLITIIFETSQNPMRPIMYTTGTRTKETMNRQTTSEYSPLPLFVTSIPSRTIAHRISRGKKTMSLEG